MSALFWGFRGNSKAAHQAKVNLAKQSCCPLLFFIPAALTPRRLLVHRRGVVVPLALLTPHSITGPGRTARFVAEYNTDILGGVSNLLGHEVDDAITALCLGSTHSDLIAGFERKGVFGPVALWSDTDDHSNLVTFKLELDVGTIIACLNGNNVTTNRSNGIDIVTGFKIQGGGGVAIVPPEAKGRKGERQEESQQK